MPNNWGILDHALTTHLIWQWLFIFSHVVDWGSSGVCLIFDCGFQLKQCNSFKVQFFLHKRWLIPGPKIRMLFMSFIFVVVFAWSLIVFFYILPNTNDEILLLTTFFSLFFFLNDLQSGRVIPLPNRVLSCKTFHKT